MEEGEAKCLQHIIMIYTVYSVNNYTTGIAIIIHEYFLSLITCKHNVVICCWEKYHLTCHRPYVQNIKPFIPLVFSFSVSGVMHTHRTLDIGKVSPESPLYPMSCAYDPTITKTVTKGEISL